MNRLAIPSLGLALILCASSACEQGAGKKAKPNEQAAPAKPSAQPAGDQHPAVGAIEAFNRRDWKTLLGAFTPTAELMVLDSTQDPVRGREAIRAYLGRLLFAFPDAHAKPVRVMDGGQVWLLEVMLEGTQLGEFLGQGVSQKRVGTQLAIYAWLEQGRIRKALLCANPLAVLRQIQSETGERRWLPPAAMRTEIVTAAGDAGHTETVRAFFRTFETADLAALSKHVTDQVVVYAYGDGNRLQGIDTLRLTLIKEREAFDGKIALEDAVAIGPYVAAVVRISGTLKTDVNELKATGKDFAERGIDVFRFDGDRIAEWDNYRNLMDLMRQLGIPTDAPK